MKSAVTLAIVFVVASFASCDNGCVRLFSPKDELSHGEIAAELAADSAGAASFDHSRYAEVLDAHVDYDSARVDYAGLAGDEARLDAYLEQLADAELDALNSDAQLALLINAYNAFTLKLILEHYPDLESIKDIDKPWDTRRWELGGHQVSLNEIEHGLIRPIYRDSRIHFAVNCASVGCPPLAPWPYTGTDIDEQLDRAAKRTLGDDRYARVEGDELQVTSLMNWYKPDFVGGEYEPSAESVPAYVAMYGDDEIRELVESEDEPSYSFIDYDWALNDVE